MWGWVLRKYFRGKPVWGGLFQLTMQTTGGGVSLVKDGVCPGERVEMAEDSGGENIFKDVGISDKALESLNSRLNDGANRRFIQWLRTFRDALLHKRVAIGSITSSSPGAWTPNDQGRLEVLHFLLRQLEKPS